MNNLLNTLLEEKEKLDKLYQMEEQHRKRIHENLDMLTIDKIKEMSLEDKTILKEKFGLSIDDMKMREALYIEVRRGLIEENGPASHYPFLKDLDFLTSEQIYEFDQFIERMRNLNVLYKDVAVTELDETLKAVAEYDNTKYKAMELTDDQWKQIIDMLVEHKIGKCMLKISACASGDTCWIDQTEYEKVRSGNASEEEKEELYDQIHENTCGYCEVSMCCEDLGYSNFMDEIKICGLIFQKDQKEWGVLMNLYEYKLVVGKIKVKKYEVTEGRTAYKLNSSSTRDCFEYNDSNNLAKNEMEKVLNKQKEWERDNSLFMDGDVLYFHSTDNDIKKAKKEFGNYLKNVLREYDRILANIKKNRLVLSATGKQLYNDKIKIEEVD